MHSPVSLHRVRLLFFFSCAFIDAYSVGTSIPLNRKGCTTASVGGTRSPFFFHAHAGSLGFFVFGFGAPVLSFILVHICIYVK